MELKPEFDDEKLVLIFRSALVDDSSCANEQMGALAADISVDEDEIWITVDDELWPDVASTPNVDTLAEMLGFEVVWEGVVREPVFPWPAIGVFFKTTTQYIQHLMVAYHTHRKNEG